MRILSLFYIDQESEIVIKEWDCYNLINNFCFSKRLYL